MKIELTIQDFGDDCRKEFYEWLSNRPDTEVFDQGRCDTCAFHAFLLDKYNIKTSVWFEKIEIHGLLHHDIDLGEDHWLRKFQERAADDVLAEDADEDDCFSYLYNANHAYVGEIRSILENI